MPRKRNNKPTLKSNLEYKFLEELKALKSKHKYNLEYESEELKYYIAKTYIPDFTLKYRDGRVLHLEIKGYFRPEDREKLRAVREANPKLDVRLVFDKDNKIHAKSKMRYSDWCNKYKFLFAIGHIPEEWLTE